jgi:hypothetical protein
MIGQEGGERRRFDFIADVSAICGRELGRDYAHADVPRIPSRHDPLPVTAAKNWKIVAVVPGANAALSI